MERYSEDLLKDLGLDDGERVRWYKARHYVMNVMEPLDGQGISPTSDKRVHVVIENADEPLMQAVIRQVCLIAHYPNFDEESGECRTLVTLCSDNPADTYRRMKDERILGNLLEYCPCNQEPDKSTRNLIPIDIEFEFLGKNSYSANETKTITLSEVEKALKDFDATNARIDITKGMLVNMVYNTGAEIQNLPATDNANIERYSTALNVFCYKLKSDMICRKWAECARRDNKGKYKETDIKNKLSSVFCADCFEARMKGLFDTSKKPLEEHILHHSDTVMRETYKERNLKAFARCEHARWNVEKLIMGYEPLLEKDWYELECCFGKERDKKIKDLKRKKHKHIDLCSCKNLRRLNPADIKYDYFLMLAMPHIMRNFLLAK